MIRRSDQPWHPVSTRPRPTKARPTRVDPGPATDPAPSIPSSGPALPHDRDEQAGMTGGVQSPLVQQGARDLKRGVLDTSRAPEAEAAYRKLKR